jgi:N4-(beta-N-acetylglucosaminyl)-L-asparaginase
MQRRNFIQLLSTASTLALLPKPLFAMDSASPVVISTWEPNKKANNVAWQVVQSGGAALDAVHAGVQVPEADPEDHSVGFGGLPDRDGKVTLDACIMDHLGNIGSVMGLEHIMHAISVAKLVMEKTPHVQLVGDGALEFALLQGFKKQNLLTPYSEATWKKWLKKSNYDPMDTVKDIEQRIKENHDTIGMLALDVHNNLSGACSTSGMAYKLHGRVGDSPIIGAGLFVDNEVGAATATGIGEEVVRICGSHTIVEAMRYGKTAQEACEIAVKRLAKLKGEEKAKKIQVGFIALSKHGDLGCYSMLPDFTAAVRDANGESIITSKSLYAKE